MLMTIGRFGVENLRQNDLVENALRYFRPAALPRSEVSNSSASILRLTLCMQYSVKLTMLMKTQIGQHCGEMQLKR